MGAESFFITLIGIVDSFLWIVFFAAAAGAAVYRLRATPSGLVLGGCFGLLSLKLLVITVLHSSLLRPYPAGRFGPEVFVTLSVVSQIISTFVHFAIAAGVAFIPWSLKKRAGAGAKGR